MMIVQKSIKEISGPWRTKNTLISSSSVRAFTLPAKIFGADNYPESTTKKFSHFDCRVRNIDIDSLKLTDSS